MTFSMSKLTQCHFLTSNLPFLKFMNLYPIFKAPFIGFVICNQWLNYYIMNH